MQTSTLTIDDLTKPVLAPAQQEILGHFGGLSIDLHPDVLIEEAMKHTGLDDFGPEDFRSRLDVYADAADSDGGNTNLNRFILRNRIVRLLSQRLLLTDLLRRHPEIHDIDIEKPIIVVGLPRSGTTHLVNLIAADSRRRALPYWESQEPFPLRGEGPDADGVDPRFARSTAEHEAAMTMTPLVQAMHDRFPRRSRKRSNFSTSTSPATYWSGTPAYRSGETSISRSTRTSTTHTCGQRCKR